MKQTILFLLLFSLCACAPRSAKVKFKNDGAIYIQVEIAGKKYPFLFDTGAVVTVFSDSLVQELGSKVKINEKDSTKTLRVHSRSNQRFTYKKYNDIILKIGGVAIKSSFVSEKGHQHDNIIGMDVISQMHWLFDFKDSTVVLSDKTIPFKQDSLKKLDINCDYNQSAMCTKLQLNDSVYKWVIFDTGYHIDNSEPSEGSVSFGSPELIVETTTENLNNKMDELGNIGGRSYSFTTPYDSTKRMILTNLKVQDMPMKYFTVRFLKYPKNEEREQVLLYEILTFGFIVNRFSYMQINPETKNVSLFSDGTEYTEQAKRVRAFYNDQVEKVCREKGYVWIPEEE